MLFSTGIQQGGAAVFLVWLLRRNGLWATGGHFSSLRPFALRIAQAAVLFCSLLLLQVIWDQLPGWTGWRARNLIALGMPPGGGLVADATVLAILAIYTEMFYRLYVLSTLHTVFRRWWIGAVLQAVLYATARGPDGGWLPMACVGLLLALALLRCGSVVVLVVATTLWDWASALMAGT